MFPPVCFKNLDDHPSWPLKNIFRVEYTTQWWWKWPTNKDTSISKAGMEPSTRGGWPSKMVIKYPYTAHQTLCRDSVPPKFDHSALGSQWLLLPCWITVFTWLINNLNISQGGHHLETRSSRTLLMCRTLSRTPTLQVSRCKAATFGWENLRLSMGRSMENDRTLGG